MLWTMAMILFVLWVLGMVSGAPLGMWIHLFLLSALVAALLALMGLARRPGL
ncbi:MAG: lmo0937 family membrane protein [Myxococcota bacterium]